jgi:MFS family permease
MSLIIKKFTNSKKISTFAIVVSVFLCYTGMYAVRKSFLAGQYTTLFLGYGIDAKTVLVISQVLGYMVSKFVGIKIISEMPKSKRSKWLISFISFALLMLALFAVVPGEWKIVALFFNGLPLGMVFGIVFSYIEGRKNTEMLAAALSATFIFSTGLVKTVGLILMKDFDTDEYTMPFYTGLLFFPLFLFSVWILNKSKDPDASDIKARSERVPMYRKERKEFIKANGVGYFGLVAIYILLTVVRDFRDNFIVEFWAEQGYSGSPQIVTLTEIPVAIIVLAIAAAGILIRNNNKAFNAGMWLTAAGAVIIMIFTTLFNLGLISPVIWMVTSGIGIYLPYILFHCLVFERLVAVLNFKGNVGFLFYMADALGYLGSVIVLLLKEVIGFKQTWAHFFVWLNLQSAALLLLLALFVMWYFNKRISEKKTNQVVAYP